MTDKVDGSLVLHDRAVGCPFLGSAIIAIESIG